MKIEFKVESFLEIEVKKNDLKPLEPTVIKTMRFALCPSSNLMAETYLDEDGQPTKEGCEIIRDVLVSNLASMIHYAHEYGMIDSAENMRESIKQLEDVFITNGKLGTSSLVDGKFVDEDE